MENYVAFGLEKSITPINKTQVKLAFRLFVRSHHDLNDLWNYHDYTSVRNLQIWDYRRQQWVDKTSIH